MPEQNKLTENDSEKADTLLEHFTSVFTHEPIGPTPKPPQQEYQSVLKDTYITEDQIKKKLSGLLPSKSPGPDDIQPKFIKELADAITKPLKQYSIRLFRHRSYLMSGKRHMYRRYSRKVTSPVPTTTGLLA